MHFISPTTAVVLALFSTSSTLAAPFIEKRAVSFHVLQAGTGVTDGCDGTQIQQLNDMIGDTKSFVNIAINTLAQPNVKQSSGFVAIFGPSSDPAALSSAHFAPLLNLQTPTPIASTTGLGANDLTFTCPPSTDPKAKVAFASTRNFKQGTQDNLIRFLPLAFTGAQPFSEAAAQFKAGGKFTAPPLAFTMVHECQHSIPVVGATSRVGDIAIGGVKMYGLQQIQNTLPVDQKTQNAQNFAWFAMLAASRPELFTDDCGGTPVNIPRANLNFFSRRKGVAKPPSAKTTPKAKTTPVVVKTSPTTVAKPTTPAAVTTKAATTTKAVSSTAAVTTKAVTTTKAVSTTAASTNSVSKGASKSTSSSVVSSVSSASTVASANGTSSATSASASASAPACQKITGDFTTFNDIDEDVDGLDQ